MKLIRKSTKKIIYDSGLTYIGGTEEEIDRIKNKLTFNNPSYENAMKYTRYNSVAISPYLTYYETGTLNKEPYIKVPIGLPIMTLLDFPEKVKTIDNRLYEKVKTPPFKLKLRPDQQEAFYNYTMFNQDIRLQGSVQMPTGKGKSILGLALASHYSCKTLVVVHKDDLVTGWKKDIALAFNNKVVTGLIKAKSRKVGDFITIATVQTLNKLSAEELNKLYETFSLVIQDEMHHCPASSYSITSNFRARYKLGLSATPERSDGLDQVIPLYYGTLCYKYVHDEDDEDILPVEVIIKSSPLYFNPLCQEFEYKNKKHYKVVDMHCPKDYKLCDDEVRLSDVPYTSRPKVHFQEIDGYVVMDEHYKNMVCKDIIKEYEQGNSCIAFFTQKEHVNSYYEYLIEHVNLSDIGLFYGDNKDNNEVLEHAEKQQQFITLATYAKATEGTNVKNWRVAFLVSSINNEKNVEQAVGRVRRTKEGKESPAIVYDYRVPEVYSMSSHGSTRDRRYRALKFSIRGVNRNSKRGMFSRGFH